MSQNTMLDLDSMLDETLDNVEDLPDYVEPATGVYMLGVADCKLETFTKRGKDGQPDLPNQVRIRLTNRIDGIEELEPNSYPVEVGSLFSDTFMFNEMGKAIFKKVAKNIMNVEDVDGVPFRELFDALKGAESYRATVTNKKKGEYTNINVRPLHEAAE
jgi:hypothetical protein